jgi:hypothetical protein
MLRSIGKNVLRLVIASFLLVPVILTAFLLHDESKKAQEAEEAPDSEIPLASKIIKRGTIDDQRGSALFTILPPEIRNRIFAFACKAYETIPYTPNDWYYRPGYHAHRRISTTLLATCKRIYLETYNLPLELNEHVFWGSIERGPPRRYSGIDNYKRTDLNAFFDCLKPHQRASIQEVHLFAQQFWLEDLDLSSDRIATRKIKLTLRHQDWYFWEDNEPLGICPWLPGRVSADDMEREKDMVPSLPRDIDRYVGWGRQFEFVRGLEELEIEFETLTVFKEVEMDPIVTFAKQWQFPLMREGVLEWDEASRVRQSTWTGSKLLRGELDESMFGFYEDNLDSLDSIRDADHGSRPDSPDYDTGSTYEFSDWEDAPSSLVEQEYSSADIVGHSYSATTSQLRQAGSDAEQTSVQQEPMTELSSPTNPTEMIADEQEMTGPVLYEPPQIFDADDNPGIEDELPTIADAAADNMQDLQPSLPLLALESNVQDYYVVSLIWRKRK